MFSKTTNTQEHQTRGFKLFDYGTSSEVAPCRLSARGRARSVDANVHFRMLAGPILTSGFPDSCAALQLLVHGSTLVVAISCQLLCNLSERSPSGSTSLPLHVLVACPQLSGLTDPSTLSRYIIAAKR